ncbi:MAG TPA: hypothetical protein VKB58_15335 [Terriglobales bacterium]|nr:hypothetical protein [Terriglobales bacterium]
MSFLRILLVILVVSFVAPALVFAQFPIPTTRSLEDNTPAEIRELVSRYCRLDYEGARLDSQAWQKLEPSVWWKSNPKYTQIDVVARYAVDMPAAVNRGKTSVTVHYRLLGIFDVATGYVPESPVADQDVDFQMSSDNSEWRIADVENTAPHPSRAAMLKWLSQSIAASQDAAAKERYESALKQLQAQSASPFAK